MFSSSSTLLASSLLPQQLLSELQLGTLNEESMLATAVLVCSTALEAIKAFQRRDYTRFDGNPGDAGCQNRALIMYQMAHLDLQSECSSLQETIQNIRKIIMKRHGDHRGKCSPQEFFFQQLGSVTVSKEMEFLIHSYLSKVMRTPYEKLSSGVVQTRTEISKLATLSKNIDIVRKDLRKKIGEENQKKLSDLTIQAMRMQAACISSISHDQKALTEEMLSSKHTHIYTSDITQYEPKSFGCLFFATKTVLARLKEMQALICVTSIVPDGQKRFRILMQPSACSDELSIIEPETVSQDTPLVVFECVVAGNDPDLLIDQVRRHGFHSLILSQAAYTPQQFEPNSGKECITIAEARNELDRTPDIGRDLFSVDHVFMNKKGDEFCRG